MPYGKELRKWKGVLLAQRSSSKRSWDCALKIWVELVYLLEATVSLCLFLSFHFFSVRNHIFLSGNFTGLCKEEVAFKVNCLPFLLVSLRHEYLECLRIKVLNKKNRHWKRTQCEQSCSLVINNLPHKLNIQHKLLLELTARERKASCHLQ